MALPRPGSARALVGVAALPAAFALAAGLLLFARPASAQITTLEEAPQVVDTEEPFPFAVLGLTGLGTFNTYSMSDVNKSIEQMNREITQPGVKFPRFTRGASMGGGIRAILDERLILEATWEQVNAGETIGGTAVNDLNVSAHAYLFTATWDMMKARRVAFGPGLGVGYYDSIAEQTITETPVGEDPQDLGTIRFNGSALGAHGGVTFETSLTGHVWVNAFLGYRRARIKDLEIAGFRELSETFQAGGLLPQTRAIAVPLAYCAECTDEDHNGYPEDIPEDAEFTMRNGGNSLDYSGFLGKLALTWYFNVPVE